MPEKRLFEYAVIRVVPRVEREEFLNVGVVLCCKPTQFLAMKFELMPARLQALCPAVDLEAVALHLQAFEKICQGHPQGGPISKLPPVERFRWLTATRSTVVQTSPVHTGLCDDPDQKLAQLFAQLVQVV